MFTLDNCIKDKVMLVAKVKGEEVLKRRFLDLGFIPGEKIECVLISPFHDPKAYLVNGNIIALRNKDARNIEVTYE